MSADEACSSVAEDAPAAAGSREEDASVVAVQLGRVPRGEPRIVLRCRLALPVVVEVPPVLPDGTPFPTRYWLTCPLARRRVSRLEAAGGVRAMDARLSVDADFRERHLRATDRYRHARDSLVPEGAVHRPRGGVGGAAQSVKCLHAHLAHRLAGEASAVGEEVERSVGPLSCTTACVVGRGSAARRSDAWREPR